MNDANKLIIVSNRLPMVLKETNGNWQLEAGTGGLVNALAPVLKERGGVWIGWPGGLEEAPIRKIFAQSEKRLGYNITPVSLSPREVDGYYYGFSNETVWPLFHSLLGRAVFNLDDWETYREVNGKFATAAAEAAGEDDFIWFQDYQLLLAGKYFKKLRPGITAGFFLHIPFPSPDIFYRLPWRGPVIRALLNYDLIGFQTRKDLRNFIHCVKSLIPHARVNYRSPYSVITWENRTVLTGAFPIGIDFKKYNDLAESREVEQAAWFLHEKFRGHKLLIGVDRLDYTKGIPSRFEAFALALEKYPELRENVSLLQVVVPSRMEVPKYQAMKRELDELVGRINGRFTTLGWIPIHYVFGTLTPVELVAHYRSCEIALITPLNDGMNLVAKEYCASCIDNRGILILSEFAGAAIQLKTGAILVNPYDVEQTADAIRRAFTMPAEEKIKRMQRLRHQVKKYNVYHWVGNFLNAAGAVEGSQD
ncbi:MAG: trehalose-6-phosphate synthase [Candidatus Euphemobacter frigidus]|nr:trehalose-6-phosphate synthase [Candidatus Euphemobacter frigidus]MDP8276068.1 trehalose-6-phosphate synthase [Candidatus Euphemobacter frigidus]